MTLFRGNGIVWDGERNKPLCRFENNQYETSDKREIEILKKIEGVFLISEDADYEIVGESKQEIIQELEYSEVKDNKSITKKQLIEEAKLAGIKGADRMSKDELLNLLGE